MEASPVGKASVLKSRETSLIWAVRSFLGLGAVLFGAGVAIPIGFRAWNGRFLLFSPRTDEMIFGRTPEEIVAREPAVLDVQLFYLDLAVTLLLAMGVLVASVTWFGLRAGRRWAWWALFVSFVIVAVSLARTVLPYHFEASLGLTDVPPLLWVLVLAPIPLVLGWRGTRGDGS